MTNTSINTTFMESEPRQFSIIVDCGTKRDSYIWMYETEKLEQWY